MHRKVCRSKCTVLGDHLPNATSDLHFCTKDRISLSLATKTKEKHWFDPHIYCQKQPTQRKCARKPPHEATAWGHRLHQIDMNYLCADRTRAYHNVCNYSTEVRKIGLFRGKPCLRDHLSITTIFPCTVGWLLKTGFILVNLPSLRNLRKFAYENL